MALTVPARWALVLMLVAVALDVLPCSIAQKRRPGVAGRSISNSRRSCTLAICAYSLLQLPRFRAPCSTPSAGISTATTSDCGRRSHGAFRSGLHRRRSTHGRLSGFVLAYLLERSACHPFSESGFYTSSPSSSTRRRSSWEDSCSSCRARWRALSESLPVSAFAWRHSCSSHRASQARFGYGLCPRPSLGFGARPDLSRQTLLLVLIFSFYTGLPHRSPAASARRSRTNALTSQRNTTSPSGKRPFSSLWPGTR